MGGATPGLLCPALVSLPRARGLWGNCQDPVGLLCVQEAAGSTPSESWRELGLLRLGKGELGVATANQQRDTKGAKPNTSP